VAPQLSWRRTSQGLTRLLAPAWSHVHAQHWPHHPDKAHMWSCKFLLKPLNNSPLILWHILQYSLWPIVCLCICVWTDLDGNSLFKCYTNHSLQTYWIIYMSPKQTKSDNGRQALWDLQTFLRISTCQNIHWMMKTQHTSCTICHDLKKKHFKASIV
jgi:hypothetical protein